MSDDSTKPGRQSGAREGVRPVLLGLIVLAAVLVAAGPAARGQEIRLRAPAGAGQSAAAAPKADEPYSFAKIVLSMGAVVGLIFALKWGAGKIIPGAGVSRPTRAISVVSRLAVAPKQQLMLVKVGRRVVLVSNTGAQMNALCEITDPDEVATLMGQVESEKSSAPIAGAFGSLFRNQEENFDSQRPRDGSAASDGSAAADEDEQVGAAREELSGLAERVRLLSKSYHKS